MRLLPLAALVAAFAVTATVSAQQATQPAPANKADCEKAKLKWDAKGGKDGKGACVTSSTAPKK